jgi:sugar (pentulose or hexulose) kinase
MTYLLGIDVGTSVVKSVLFNLKGEELVVSRRTPSILRNQPGWSEMSMDGLWADVVATLREVAASDTLKHGEIAGIGLTGMCCSSWLLDGAGQPVRNAILWNDGRAADIIGDWQRDGVLDEVFRIGGNIMFPGYTVAVLRWLQEHEPETLERARWSVYCKDWIRFKLTGEIATDHSDAGYMPYDLRASEYSDTVLRACGVESARRLFPDVLESGDVAGRLLPEVAAETGLSAGIPVVAGLVDVAASTLGAGAYRPGQACTIVGTSFLNNFIYDAPSFEPFGIGVQTRTTPRSWVRSLVNTAGTMNLEWFINQFCAAEKASEKAAGRSIYDWAEATASAIPLGSEGIIYHPYLNTTGVIAPFLNPVARAQFFGISVEHTRAHMLRAVYEGTALAMLDSYMQVDLEVDEWFIAGGGKRSRFWTQMFADATGRTILVPEGEELGARGVAILAGVASGAYSSIEDAMGQIIHISREHQPDAEAHEKYLRIYELYKRLYEHVMDDWWERHRLLGSL